MAGIPGARLPADLSGFVQDVKEASQREIEALTAAGHTGPLPPTNYLPETFDAPHPEDFDTGYMKALFQVGYDLAVKGYSWAKAPPGY